jgi:hypothetical protein
MISKSKRTLNSYTPYILYLKARKKLMKRSNRPFIENFLDHYTGNELQNYLLIVKTCPDNIIIKCIKTDVIQCVCHIAFWGVHRTIAPIDTLYVARDNSTTMCKMTIKDVKTNKPRHDKTNIIGLRSAWIQTSLPIRTIWSGIMLFAISFSTCNRVG